VLGRDGKATVSGRTGKAHIVGEPAWRPNQ